MIRKTRVFRIGLVSLLALLATANTASAGVRLNGVDFGAYPTIGATVVTSAPSAAGPKLLENGRPVVGLQAVNLGRCKNVVLALDTSRSMAGKPLAEAGAAATAFVASKPACDRMALVTFGQRASQQGPFSSATIDADNALRNLAVGANSGTALWDAVDLAASSSCSPTATTLAAARRRPPPLRRCTGRARSSTRSPSGRRPMYPASNGLRRRPEAATTPPRRAER